MSAPSDYGAHYWCVTGEGEPVRLYADRLEVTGCGALVAWGGCRKEGGHAEHEQALWSAAPGQWTAFFATSLLDGRGRAVAIEAQG